MTMDRAVRIVVVWRGGIDDEEMPMMLMPGIRSGPEPSRCRDQLRKGHPPTEWGCEDGEGDCGRRWCFVVGKSRRAKQREDGSREKASLSGSLKRKST